MSKSFSEIRDDVLESLQDDSFFLQCLHQAGLDNWDGYEVALELYRNSCGSNYAG